MEEQTAVASTTRTPAGEPRARLTRAAIVALLFGFSLISYFDRTIMSIAGPSIMSEFHLSETEMGTVYSAFLFSYALLMIPGGRMADRFGPRIVLTWMGFGSALFTALTALGGTPGLGTAFGIVTSFLLVRLGMGVFTAPLYPTCGRMNANWIPARQRAGVQGIINAGAGWGGAISPILFSWMIRRYGWRSSFGLAALATAALALAWTLYARDYPAQHPAIRGDGVPSTLQNPVAPRQKLRWRLLFTNRNLLFLTAGYFMVDYFEYIFFYWIYYYLGTIRHLGADRSAVYTTYLFVAWIILTPAGGWMADRLTARLGVKKGLRLAGMAPLAVSAVLLVAAVNASGTATVVTLMALALGLASCSDVAFWVATIEVGGSEVGAAGAIMNTGGNVGGFVAPILTPVIAARFGWSAALYFASAVALAALVSWLFVDPESSGRGPRLETTDNSTRSRSA